MINSIIYVPLLNEGTVVFRPVRVEQINNNIYKILSSDDGSTPEEIDEVWAYQIDSYVSCVVKIIDGSNILIANKLLEKGMDF